MAQELRFPDGFVWGAATAAYQIEGATNEGGRGDCVWDAFSRTPGKTKNGETGAVACDHYHKYKEDIQLMKSLGLKHYRFSIAWPRIIPAGVGQVNEEGVAFYNDLINELLANGIEPLATLFHWDLPLALQAEFDGWLGSGEQVKDAFVAYARVCFERFGDRVKTWLTLNEPWITALLGYGWGVLAPGRRHNGHIEPYLVGHNLLIGHARVVDLYRREFKEAQGGRIGITLNADWSEPAPANDPQEYKRNQDAAERALLFNFGWFADPVYRGDYPEVMKQRCGDRLPQFTEDERKLVKGSSDFFGLNSYSTRYAAPTPEYLSGAAPDGNGSFNHDAGVQQSLDPSWKLTDVNWAVVPEGFEKLLLWIQKRYHPEGGIYITENGCAWAGETKEESVNDDFRADFYRAYITHMHKAIKQGADIRGYYAWSFMDNYEWAEGYSKRFGLVYVDYETQERTPKKSALAYSDIIRKNAVVA